MPSQPKPAPKHRAATPHRAPQVARRAAAKTTLTLSSMAVVATGVAVGTGSLSLPAVSGASAQEAAPHPASADTAAAAFVTAPLATALGDASASTSSTSSVAAEGQQEAGAAAASRSQVVTRSDARDTTDSLKADALSLGQGNTLARTENLSDEAPQLIAQALLSEYGWSPDQFSCLDSLWTRESNWNVHADNPSSSAYGIPQALPGSKMASAGPDWANNAVTQIKWGLGYIAERYGSPCGAWAHSQSSGFY